MSGPLDVAAELQALRDRVADLEAVVAELVPKDPDPTGVRRFAARLRARPEEER